MTRTLGTATALALLLTAAPATAQHAHQPGMTMPMPKKAPAKKAAPKKAPAKKAPAKKAAPRAAAKAAPAPPRSEAAEPPVVMEQPPAAPPAEAPPAPAPMEMDHDGHAAMADEAPMPDHKAHGAMTGALGPYPMTRESSGTAWQPDSSEHPGLMRTSGDWTLMAHGVVNLVYDHQGGRRGGDKAFASGMLMGIARRPVGNGTLQLKAMVSPDPLMGKSGYPLLLASGETADGTHRLIDRQHPHDFFMELSASASQAIGTKSSLFLYAGLPGEPAFGPPAFMHREAILDSPEAPISHHWLDSTHISFGVLTAGLVVDRVKVEVSRFNGREPDQHRWDIETGPLNSTAVRLSWNPTDRLSLQGSWGHFEDPEQLEPGVDQKRWSASALYAREVGDGMKLAGTLAWGRKSVEHHGEWWNDDAFVAEASLKYRRWTGFARGEMTENRELFDEEAHGEAYRVGKLSLGLVHDVDVAEHWSLGVGGLASLNFVPDELEPEYGSSHPLGSMAFVRLRLK